MWPGLRCCYLCCLLCGCSDRDRYREFCRGYMDYNGFLVYNGMRGGKVRLRCSCWMGASVLSSVDVNGTALTVLKPFTARRYFSSHTGQEA